MTQYAKIIVDLHHQKVDQVYTYRVGNSLEASVQEGMLVEVPFGGRRVTGYVVELSRELLDDIPPEKLKEIGRILSEEPIFTKANLELAKQMQQRYYAPLSSCLSLFIPRRMGKTSRSVTMVRLLSKELDADRLGEGQRRFLQRLAAEEGQVMSLAVLRREAPLGKASLLSLVQKEYVALYEESEGKPPAAFISEINRTEPLPLTAEQLAAKDAIVKAVADSRYEGFLLHGITGSGKTEIYMQCIQAALDRGRQAILLVPEISLTPQVVDVFTKRFGENVSFTHSRLTDSQRAYQWQQARSGKVQVMIGPRSALFTAFPNLGLVIIDEEHETTYKSEKQSPHYHAREVAEMLCRQQSCPLVLGSATPSIETYFQTFSKNLTLLTLKQRAVPGAVLPRVELVDMRQELERGNMSLFCRKLQTSMKERLDRGEQIILFLNRKGYATFVNCRQCGFVLKCPRCYLPYTYHKDQDKLICHHCGKEAKMPAVCPNCGSRHVRQFGAGTQRIQEEAARLFPNARIVRMDMDTMRSRDQYEAVYKQFQNREGDILIGTQMIAKGFDFPGVTLVGVVAADMSLYSSDYHSTERTFQLITQVAGRAGRGGRQGLVLVQTYSPEHYAIQDAKQQNYERFYQDEIAARKIMQCPPFTHLAQILLTGPKKENVVRAVKRLADLMAHYGTGRPFEILGPSPASLERINNMFRWKILVKCEEEGRLRAFVAFCCEKLKQEEKAVTVMTDIDPVTLA